jgi:sugar phosphate isomerase/epimerase
MKPTAVDPRLARLSLNQRSVPRWSMPELVDRCARSGVSAVGLWREPVAEYGLTRTSRLVRDGGIRVSSLCRGGFFTSADPARWKAAIEDNLRAIDEAVELRADCLMLVVGGMPAGTKDLTGARNRVREALAVLAPAAGERGIRLAVEALHPMFCADRAVVSTLRQALGVAQAAQAGLPTDAAGPTVGVTVDAYHVWWDPELASTIAEAGPHIFSFQVSDWVLPLATDPLLSRGMIGDGCIDLRAMRSAVDAAGYTGDVEVEIFNQSIWDGEGDVVLSTILERCLQHVL